MEVYSRWLRAGRGRAGNINLGDDRVGGVGEDVPEPHYLTDARDEKDQGQVLPTKLTY